MRIATFAVVFAAALAATSHCGAAADESAAELQTSLRLSEEIRNLLADRIKAAEGTEKHKCCSWSDVSCCAGG